VGLKELDQKIKMLSIYDSFFTQARNLLKSRSI